MRFSLLSLLGLALAVAAVTPACSGDGKATSSSSSSNAGGSGGAGGGAASSVIVEPESVTLTVPLGGSATQTYQAFTDIGGKKTDITDTCSFSIDPAFGNMVGPKLVALPHGGATQVIADCGKATGKSALTVKLVGDVSAGASTPENAADIFKAAQTTDDPARKPSIVYPLDKAIAPLNIPAIDVQYLAAQNDLFHVSIASTNLEVNLYTTDISAALSEADWVSVASTAAGDSLTIAVEGLSQAAPGQKYRSADVTFRLSHDTVDKTALYYWASSKGNLMTQTFGSADQPTAVKNDCTSCHSVSRSGSRIGYSRCVGGDCGQIFVGFMKYDKNGKQWVDTVNANNKAIAGSYTTFAPLGNPFPGDQQSVALVTLSGGKLALYNPDTGEAVPSNADVASTKGPGGAPRAALMPDWSPDGKTVVFTSTPYPGQWIDLSEGAIATMSYSYAGGQHTFGDPQLLVQGTLDLPSGKYNNFFFPSFSPDGSYIVFNAARAQWRQFQDAASAGQRLMLTSATGAFTVELAAMNGEGDLDITWPHWAPGSTNDYLWIVFSSERPYGHKVTPQNSNPACVANGVKQCKQLWIGAVDKKKLMTMGMQPEDPSAPPVWLPGQDIGADNISPYWTVPTDAIPQ
jgi:Tol biopolymer transport system component